MKAAISPEEEYVQLGELVATIPTFGEYGSYRQLTQADHLWFGRLHALLEGRSASIEHTQLQLAWSQLLSGAHERAYRQIQAILFAALARSELSLPVKSRGAFVAAGNHFDALASIGRVLREAKGSLLVVDPYLNERFLMDFAGLVGEGVSIRLLGGSKGVDGTLAAAVGRWAQQYGATRPIEARLAPKGMLHDRVILDSDHAWALSQSFKDFAARSPGSIIRTDPELAELKRQAFEGIWSSAIPL